MPRKASIWLRAQTGYYCTTIKGEIVKLSKDKKEAEALFHELMAAKARDVEPEPAKQFGPSFKKLAEHSRIYHRLPGMGEEAEGSGVAARRLTVLLGLQ